MRGHLLNSLLELAHATSQNLGFAHNDDVCVSYGEETITETNLLELRRRHPAIIKLSTFGRKKESQNGADWEWHIIGRCRTFRMRVQAKRLQKNDKLKIPHEVKSSGKQQIDLLINDAKLHHLKPVYCFYSAERQRGRWKKEKVGDGFETFEAGCLLAEAQTVKKKMPKTLAEIEKQCVPWHYLVERQGYAQTIITDLAEPDVPFFRFMMPARATIEASSAKALDSSPVQGFPTLEELNDPAPLKRNIEGLIGFDEGELDYRERHADYVDRGISRLLELDIREFPATPVERDIDR